MQPAECIDSCPLQLSTTTTTRTLQANDSESRAKHKGRRRQPDKQASRKGVHVRRPYKHAPACGWEGGTRRAQQKNPDHACLQAAAPQSVHRERLWQCQQAHCTHIYIYTTHTQHTPNMYTQDGHTCGNSMWQHSSKEHFWQPFLRVPTATTSLRHVCTALPTAQTATPTLLEQGCSTQTNSTHSDTSAAARHGRKARRTPPVKQAANAASSLLTCQLSSTHRAAPHPPSITSGNTNLSRPAPQKRG